jgi:peptidyl-prolyl cis-trans isomerase SurA
MTHSLLALTVAIFATLSAQAQSVPAAPNAVPQQQRATDFIVAVVNSEPITNQEVMRESQRALQQLAQQGKTQVKPQELARQVLERLINDKIQLQLAKETGIKVDDAALDLAEQNIARQNQIDVATLRQRLATEGMTSSQFRAQLRDQLTLTRLRERDVEPRVRVSDQEVEQFLREQQGSNPDPASMEMNLSQILIAVPESATPPQVAALEARAKRVLERVRAGNDFADLVREFSDAPDRANGGQLGLRTADRYPPLFFEATKALNTGDISGLVRSGAGFHILKVTEKKSTGLPAMAVTQSRARHILLRITPQVTEAAARSKLMEFKKQIIAGKDDFAALAREFSQDGSATQGGDLGWANPGMFVPEFEEAMNRLAPSQISDPLVSRFGVHLIQLVERRQAALNPREQKETIRAQLREKKLDEAYVTWTRDLRGRAYIEMREPAQ